MATPFRHTLTIPFQDIDAAGIVFFAHLYRYAHEAYERFMSEVGQPLPRLLKEGDYHLPLIHSEADFHQPLRHGEVITVELAVERLGNSAFTLAYRLLDEEQRLRATVQTVHVAIDPATGQSIPLPESLREALSPYLAEG